MESDTSFKGMRIKENTTKWWVDLYRQPHFVVVQIRSSSVGQNESSSTAWIEVVRNDGFFLFLLFARIRVVWRVSFWSNLICYIIKV